MNKKAQAKALVTVGSSRSGRLRHLYVEGESRSLGRFAWPSQRAEVAAVVAALALVLLAGLPHAAAAADVRVAVAANFAAPLDEVGKAFEKATGNHLVVS